MLPTAMKIPPFIQLLPIGATILLAGCSNGGVVLWGEEAGGGGGNLSQSAGMNSGEKMATGGVSTQLIGATVEIIAKHEATERQRQIATRHAQAYLKTHPTRRQARHRYLAVDTARDSRTAPQAQKAVIIFDTESAQVVGKTCTTSRPLLRWSPWRGSRPIPRSTWAPACKATCGPGMVAQVLYARLTLLNIGQE